jgi:hypothetical protein
LVDVANHVLNRLHAGSNLLRRLLGRGGFVSGVDRVLIGFVRLVRGQLDTLLRAGVGVFDGSAVGRCQLIEFVDAVSDGLGLALNIFLAGKGINASPEAFAGRWGQRRLASCVACVGRGRLSLLRGGRLSLI